MSSPSDADDLNARLGVLTRREVEARLLKPLLDALSAEFGVERVHAVLERTIEDIAQQQGDALGAQLNDRGCAAFHASLEMWTRNDAMDIEVLAHDDTTLDFNVTRCGYADMYRELGLGEVGALLSCNRDAALIQGFNPEATFVRTQTIMQGASHCDFRYTFPDPDA